MDFAWAAVKFEALDYLPVGAFVLNPGFEVCFWNRCMEAWTGVARAAIIGRPVFEVFPRLNQPSYLTRLRPLFEGGPPVLFSSQLHPHLIPAVSPTGASLVHDVSVMAVPGCDPAGYCALFSLQDVTGMMQRIQDYRKMRDQAMQEIVERERAQEALRQSELLNRAIIEHSPVGITVRDREGRLRLSNPAWRTIWGATDADIAQMERAGQDKSVAQRFTYLQDWAPQVRELFTTGGAVQIPELEVREFRSEAAAWISQHVYALPGRDGAVEMVVTLTLDITERKQWEQTLLQRNEELARINQLVQRLSARLDLEEIITQLLDTVTALLNAEAAAVWLTNPTQQETLVCPTFFQRGRSRDCEDLRLLPGQGLMGWVVQTGESLNLDNAAADPRFMPVIATAEIQVTTLLAIPLRVQGQVIGALEVVNKLAGAFSEADRVLLETLAAPAAVAVDNAHLVERLRRQTTELQSRNEELDAFAHTVAHDIKTPLNLIIGYAELLLEDGYTTMPEAQVREFLAAIMHGGYKVNTIINELMLLSQVRLKEVPRVALEMGAIIAEAVQRLQPLIEQAGAEVTLPAAWPIALGHAPWVEEAWVNYISNALKYGGAPPRIELGAEVAAAEIRFWVRDNGQGFTAAQQAQLFAPFAQLEQGRGKGHGLGLSIVRRIAERLGGAVGVTSAVGQGSTFWFTLPKGT